MEDIPPPGSGKYKWQQLQQAQQQIQCLQQQIEE
mgnify:CR=1 FL=1